MNFVPDLTDQPSVYECTRAEQIFCDIFAEELTHGTSKDCAVRCALSAVWQAGRIWQKERIAHGAGIAETEAHIRDARKIRFVQVEGVKEA